jgi:hypothetical protein
MMTDPRVAIVREWLYRNARTIEDHGTEPVESELVAALDAAVAASVHPDEVVKRVARAISAAADKPLPELARAALSAMPPRHPGDLTQTRRIENLRAAMAQALDTVARLCVVHPTAEALTIERQLSRAIAADEAAEERMIRERKGSK